MGWQESITNRIIEMKCYRFSSSSCSERVIDEQVGRHCVIQVFGKAFISSAWHQSSLFFILLINIGPHLGHSSIWCCCSWLWQEQWACSSYSLPGLWAYTFISLAGRKRGWGHTVVCLLANMHVLQSPENQWVINIKFCAENRVEQKQPFSQWESF